MMMEMPRRSNHEGTQPRKVPGRDLWRTQVMVNGKRMAIYGKTSKEAADKRRAKVRELEMLRRPTDPAYTVGQWLDDWAELHCGHVGPRTLQSYKDTIRLYLRPALGTVKLTKLHQDDIARMLASVKGPKGPLSPTTRRYVYVVLRIALGVAMEQDRIARNPATLVTPPEKASRVVAPLSSEAVDALYAALEDHEHKALILVALTAGLREGELLGLSWSAIDLTAGTLHVRGQLERGTQQVIAPKRSSRRTVDLPAQTLDALREHKTRQKRDRIGKLDWHSADFVFTTPQGQPHTAGMPRRVLRSVLKGLELPMSTTHALRHTFVTMHLEAGTPLPVVSKLVGHRSVSTTSDQYGHLTPAMRKDAADTMANRLRRRAK